MNTTLVRPASSPAVPSPTDNQSVRARRRTAMRGASFTVPYFLGFALFIVVPVIVGLSESLYTKKSSGLGFGGQTVTFSGLDNFRRGLSDEAFWGGLLRVTLFALIVIPVIQILSLAAALLIDEVGRRAAGRFRVALLLPHMVPAIVAILIWIYLYSPTAGPLTPFFALFGVDADFYSGGLIWVSIGNIMAWSSIGFNILVIYGALQNIPREIFDSARVDGASTLRIAWSIKVPFVRTSLVLTSVLAIIGTLQIFSDPMLFRSMTPETVGRNFTPIMMIYDQAFAVGDLSYASALSIILAVVVGIVSAIFYKLTNRTPT
ncbi:carbohydrate ABC transporter permease [Actinoplanes derwentensis]|uniref:Multiple sugar transport system permease protein n=1 Tax=Actinoplanes derwentensis TaxID=113562 RepID=A0A1H1XBK0_9ACTN|nr:sugar ABC transporter permease [Actinoplanes derwentensis]GID89615.1 sugar ABC transporter permease [Actinoplanes derwentensis]SDT06076.1 multiple sugar transport system permease protein [Actinoplanes derwentensis]